MKPRFLIAVLSVFTAAVGFGPVCRAGIILSLVPSTTSVNLVNATAALTISVRLASDVGTQNIQGYSIPIDLRNPVGKGLPAGWSVLSVTSVANLSGGALFTGNTNPTEGDAYGSDIRTAGPLSFTTTPVTLFDIGVQITRATATNGTFTASYFTTGSLFSLNDSIGTTLPANQINSTGTATITVTGVPEPSSFALLFASCIGACAFLAKQFLARRPHIASL